ncbi:glycosyltransferase family 9 protein [Pseudorhodoferax sp.]|uniref:glycosyltransferase family 9 protein n=1 Tax=Pseudorhodoferax sp. TaxID=1993553 RepID=UPI002DD6B3AB|nr:glycosyltransferase family 9 protein [Pseudorhodoferax sp.]
MGWGDEIIVSGLARRAQQTDRRPVRVVDGGGRVRWNGIWQGNPRFAAPDAGGPVQRLVSGPGRRPYIARETATRWIFREWVCPVGEIHLDPAERRFGRAGRGRVLVEPHLKAAASPNKDWGRARWTALVAALTGDGWDVVQLGPAGTPLLPGAALVETPGFRAACAVLAQVRLAILPEGGLHHAAAALGTPAIVLFGGFISPSQTGYAHQLNLFSGGEPCGMRRPCRHCRQAMAHIEVERVLAEARALLAAVPEDWPE